MPRWFIYLSPIPSGIIAALAFLPYSWAHIAAGSLSAGFAAVTAYNTRLLSKTEVRAASPVPPVTSPQNPADGGNWS